MVKSPYNFVIFPLTQPQVANQQQQKKIQLSVFDERKSGKVMSNAQVSLVNMAPGYL